MSEENVTPETPEVQPEATVVSDWRSELSEDLRGSTLVQEAKSVEDVVKSALNSQKMLGNSVRIPGEDASDEAREAFYKQLENVPGVAKIDSDDIYGKLGRPESADGYSLVLPEGAELDQEALGSFKELAHELGLNNKQAQALAEFDAKRGAELAAAKEEAYNSGEAKLKEMWGGDYDNRLQGAKEALGHYKEAFPEAVEQLLASEASNNPAVVAMLSDMYKSLQEAGTISPTATNTNYGTSAAEARDIISEIRQNKQHPYHNSRDPGHKEAVAKVQKLYGIIAGQ